MVKKSHGAMYLRKAHDYITPEGQISIWILAQMHGLAAVAAERCWKWSSALTTSTGSCVAVGDEMMIGSC